MRDNSSTYFVQYQKNKKEELSRLIMQDQLVTQGMGGVLPEQADPTIFHHVLDVGCGPGGWLIEAAKTYPTMSLVGIDISHNVIKYANARAEAHHMRDRIKFYVMDALGKLDLPPASFDLVSMRLCTSFLRIWEWPKLLRELQRLTRLGGVVRVTECEPLLQTNSPALTKLCEIVQSALFRGGHLFADESAGLTSQLARLLNQGGYQQVQTKASTIQYRAGTVEGEIFCEDMQIFFQAVRPFIQKWGCYSKEYGTIYQHALTEMCQPDFLATQNLLTAWGYRPL